MRQIIPRIHPIATGTIGSRVTRLSAPHPQPETPSTILGGGDPSAQHLGGGEEVWLVEPLLEPPVQLPQRVAPVVGHAQRAP